jgi:hypothetical protein
VLLLSAPNSNPEPLLTNILSCFAGLASVSTAATTAAAGLLEGAQFDGSLVFTGQAGNNPSYEYPTGVNLFNPNN